MSEPRSKQNRRPEPLEHTKDPNFDYLGVFFGTMGLFFEHF